LTNEACTTLGQRVFYGPDFGDLWNYTTLEQSVQRLKAAGVPIVAGSDASNLGVVHGASLHRELELLVHAGLTPTEALRAASSVAAKAFGLADRGRVKVGKIADLVLVNGDPTANILAARDIHSIWKRGKRLDRQALYMSIRGPSANPPHCGL